jgi:hypothetical protein
MVGLVICHLGCNCKTVLCLVSAAAALDGRVTPPGALQGEAEGEHQCPSLDQASQAFLCSMTNRKSRFRLSSWLKFQWGEKQIEEVQPLAVEKG